MDLGGIGAMTAEDRPVVSVCIANFNGEKIIAECIESVLDQIDAPSFEIIVHDDASSDRSLEVLSRYPSVHVISSRENVGFCTSNNRMAQVARGEYLLLLNNDAALFPDALRTLHVAAREDGGKPVLSLPQYSYFDGTLLDRGFRIDPFANPIPVTDPTPTDLAMVMGSCLWISLVAWERIGGFPEFMESIGEDLYLCCYARMLGQNVRVCATSGYRHRVGHSFGGGKTDQRRIKTTFRRRALSERNKYFVLIIFFPLPLLLMIIPLHTLFLLIEGVVLAAWHRDPMLLVRIHGCALVSPILRHHELLHLRQQAQRHRAAPWRTILAPVSWFPWKLRLLWRYGMPTFQ